LYDGGLETICSANADYADGLWHQAIQIIGGGRHALFVDGALAASGLKTSSTNVATATFSLGVAGGAPTPFLNGALDQLIQINQAIPDKQAHDLYTSWSPVPLGSSGAGVNTTTWTSTVPRNLEGNYQIDLTASDTVGNRNENRSSWGLW